jgi:hypothetical protein
MRGPSFLETLRDAITERRENSLDARGAGEFELDAFSGNPALSRLQDAALRARELRDETAEFAEQLRSKLAAAGIDVTSPLELKTDGQQVLLDDPHPQRAKVEALFAADAELANAFHELAAAYSTDATIRSRLDPYRLGGEFRLQISDTENVVHFE